ncbi:MAG: TetR/AcrR family transcriptional regulator [Candidatus Cloacimonetes bacterium]|nr:TetR/AcrR family transcriptional regulator [Candidatus Cloacimonadota bacterium]
MSNVKSDAILEAATKLIVKYGYQKTSIDDICREAKIGKGTVYHYFESKEDIFVAILKKISFDVWDDMRKKIDNANSFEEKLKTFLTIPVDLLKSQSQLFMQVLSNDSFTFLDRINEFKENTQKNFFEILTSIFQYGIDHDVLRDEFAINTTKIVNLLYRLVVTAKLEDQIDLNGDSFNEIVEERQLLVEILIKGFIKNKDMS